MARIGAEVKLYGGYFDNRLVTVREVAGLGWHVYIGTHTCLTRGDMRPGVWGNVTDSLSILGCGKFSILLGLEGTSVCGGSSYRFFIPSFLPAEDPSPKISCATVDL